MKRTILLLLFIVIAITALSSIQVQSKGADCGGGVTVIAPNCIGMEGCLIGIDSGVNISFRIGPDGYAMLYKICAGEYYVCIPGCGSSNQFSHDGASDKAVQIENDTNCNCK